MLRLRFLPFIALLFLTRPLWAHPPALRIVTEHWPPISFEQSGRAEGMAVDLARMIQKIIGSKDPIEVMPWPRAYQTALTQPNVLLFSVVKTPERQKYFTFLGPIATGEISVYARGNQKFKHPSLDVIKSDFRVATHRGTAFQSQLETSGYKHIVPVNSPIHGIKMLMTGRVDAYCDDDIAIEEIFQQAGYRKNSYIKIAALAPSEIYFAFSSKTDEKTISEWQMAFEELKRNGTFEALHKQWLSHMKAPKELHLTAPPEKPKGSSQSWSDPFRITSGSFRRTSDLKDFPKKKSHPAVAESPLRVPKQHPPHYVPFEHISFRFDPPRRDR